MPRRRDLLMQSSLVFLASTTMLSSPAGAEATGPADLSNFKRVRQTQFIAALGDPSARTGGGTDAWGVWRVDPGPRGVELRNYRALEKSGGVVPARGGEWTFDKKDWWLEEHGLIMETPQFPLPAGQYVVTGGRDVTTILTVKPDATWELENGTLYDVTHLPCRAARYTPLTPEASPANARLSDFPVKPGAVMPSVDGYAQQDYAVLFVIGVSKTTPEF